jgi:hypothetical protein
LTADVFVRRGARCRQGLVEAEHQRQRGDAQAACGAREELPPRFVDDGFFEGIHLFSASSRLKI